MFGKLGVLAATLVSALAVAAPAQANTSDSCFDPPLAAACQTFTIERNVDVMRVSMGRHSFGFYQLVCIDWGKLGVVVRTNRLGVGGSRTITSDRLGLDNPTCFLSATAIGQSVTNAARARVALFD